MIDPSDIYVVQIGTNVALCEAELRTRCKILYLDTNDRLAVVKNIQVENPRKLPQSPEQLFLNRLGGAVRMVKVLEEYHSEDDVLHRIQEEIDASDRENKIQLALSTFQITASTTRWFLDHISEKNKERVRIVNSDGRTLSSGRLFRDKVLKKGMEFVLWRKGNSFLLGRTKAVQNLRNYTLRDREKPFRDARMGMLPPKLAQMLINLTKPQPGDVVLDPFCGSGTIVSEAAIMGFQAIGSDMDKDRVEGAKQNDTYLSEKFRYDSSKTSYSNITAQKYPYHDVKGVIATEGWLGMNFTDTPTVAKSSDTLTKVMAVWQEVFRKLRDSEIHTIALCAPLHVLGRRQQSIREKIFAFAKNAGYNPLALFEGKTSYVYARDGAYTSREIIVLKR